MASFYGCGSIISRLKPFRGSSLIFTTKFPKITATNFKNLGRMIKTTSYQQVTGASKAVPNMVDFPLKHTFPC